MSQPQTTGPRPVPGAPGVPPPVPVVAVKPPAVLLIGPPGVGKTTSLATLAKAGLSLRVLFTDPGGEESLIDRFISLGLPLTNLHWAYVAPGTTDWKTLSGMAKQITSFGYQDLANLKNGVNKADYRQFYDMLNIMSNFKCARTGKELGPVDSWGPDCAFVLDSASGLNIMAQDLTVGAKPTMHQGEWGIAMKAEQRVIQTMVSQCKCTVVLTAHVDKQRDELTGKILIMPSFLGQKGVGSIVKDFSDVILAEKEGDQFTWSTANSSADLKCRNLPLKNKLPPDFGPIIDSWKKRVKAVADSLDAAG